MFSRKISTLRVTEDQFRGLKEDALEYLNRNKMFRTNVNLNIQDVIRDAIDIYLDRKLYLKPLMDQSDSDTDKISNIEEGMAEVVSFIRYFKKEIVGVGK